MSSETITIFGFDSAWANNAPGAICAMTLDADGSSSFKPPDLVSFDDALAFIEAESRFSNASIVAIDQPTIVVNSVSCRPVDRVAATIVSFTGGGVQPANRSRRGIFDDSAPFWSFKARLGATENPGQSRVATIGRFILEVFPALALAALNSKFCRRLGAPKYNPAKKQKFRRDDWDAVVETVAEYAADAGISGVVDWANALLGVQAPNKSDQDKLDAVICALVGYHWRFRPRDESLMIGDLNSGYMIVPSCEHTRTKLMEAAARYELSCA